MTKKYSKKLNKEAKNTIKLGVTSMAGMSALGALGKVPGMPAQASQVTGTASAGLNLLNVGQLTKTGLTVADVAVKKKKGKMNKYLNKII